MDGGGSWEVGGYHTDVVATCLVYFFFFLRLPLYLNKKINYP